MVAAGPEMPINRLTSPLRLAPMTIQQFSALSLLFPWFLASSGMAAQVPGPDEAEVAKPEHSTVPVFWEPTLDVAFDRARRLGRPVLVAVHEPSDKASRKFLDQIYPSPLVQPLLRELVCVVASTEATAPLTEGPRKGMSVLFRTVTSAEAQAVAAEVGKRYLGDEISKAPIHLFVNAEGHLIKTRTGRLSQKDFIAFVEGVLDDRDPSWRPALDSGKRSTRSQDSAAAAPFAGLFGDDEKARKRAIQELLDAPDKTIVARIFAQIPSAETKQKLLEAARRKSGDKSWLAAVLDLAIDDKDPEVRAQAAVTAEVARIPGLLEKMLDTYGGEKDVLVRDELLRAMAASARGDRRVWAILNQAVKAKEDKSRAMAYVALARFGDADDTLASRSVDVLLRRGVKDRDARTRNAAVWALAELRSKRAIKDLEKLLKRTRKGLTKRFIEKAIDRINGKAVEGWDDSRRVVSRETIRR